MKHQLLSEGIEAILQFCRNNRVAETVQDYQKACKSITKLYDQKKIIEYDEDLTESTIQKLKTKLQKHLVIRYSLEHYMYRSLCMLQDYYQEKPFRDKYPLRNPYKYILSPFFEEQVKLFKVSVTQKPRTIPFVHSIARDFFYVLQQNNQDDFSTITHEDIYAFLRFEYTDHKGCMGNVIYTTRLLCEYLRSKGYQNVPSELLPFVLPPSRKKVLPSFRTAELKAILEQPERSTTTGKRNYAILLLASVTGLRSVDIANLKLTDIHWTEHTIQIVQHKTGTGLTLPLDQKAAVALADYILHGRPATDLSYLFLTEVKPYRKLNDRSSVANVLNKCAKQAGIPKMPRDGKSFHAFRRTMGSWLLNSESDPEMIAQILGHSNKKVLTRYLPFDPPSLRICAMGFDDIPVRSEVYR
jgi:integrase